MAEFQNPIFRMLDKRGLMFKTDRSLLKRYKKKKVVKPKTKKVVNRKKK